MADPASLLDALSDAEARAALTRCCGATRWVDGMLARRPFGSAQVVFATADQVWSTLAREDFLEAFSHHPQIGSSVTELRKRFASTAALSEVEQAQVAHADDHTLGALASANAAYLERFGHIFIVCASGKSAREMLTLLEQRLHNDAEAELRIAAAEQAKITKLRLERIAP